ncbi:MAG: hypothetical protein KBC95_03470 [Candidatus Peribacteraceae bacterium]|nr:hypothetical protein [Candidatus Peribacteraceae bacterium]
MRWLKAMVLWSLLLLVGCEHAPKQRVSVGLRVHIPDPTVRNRHRAAKIPLDLTVDYEIGGAPKPAEDDDQ